MERLTIKNLAEMSDFAGWIAKKVACPSTILLYGDLGVGKTEFARAFIRAKLGKPYLVVPSPTFTLVQQYECVSHFDLYRIKSTYELEEIGFFEALQNDIVLIEWPERAGLHLPKNHVCINIALVGDNRIIECS